MYAVLVNAASIVVGGIVGSCLRGGLPERYRKILESGLALCVLVIGVTGAVQTAGVMGLIVSIVV
ncbi:MAG: DUF554 family protein, partial [Clostridia bacterium]